MKTSKKWTIHIACYVIAALALSVLNELHPAVKYRTEVIEPQTEALQPTAVIDLDNDNPYAYAGQESDGKLHHFQRVGSSDEWRDLSDEGSQIYYRNGTVLTRAAY